MPGELVVGVRGEELGQEGVFGAGVVEEREVEVVEWRFEVVGGFVFFGEVGA